MRHLRVFVVALSLLFLNVSQAQETARVTHVLPFANANGYSSTLIVVNPTGDVVAGRVLEDRVYPPLVEVMQPHSVSRARDWPRAGVNVQEIELDAQLVAYVEVTTPRGTICRIRPLAAVVGGELDFYHLPTDATFDSSIFVAVAAGTSGFVSINGAAVPVTDEYAILLPAAGDRVTLTMGGDPRLHPVLPAPPAVYAFALVEHSATGAISTVDGF